MKILSFDVGIKNLAYCLLDNDEGNVNIKSWDCVQIPTDIKQIIEYLNNLYEEKLELILSDIDVVLIEKQPNRNPRMKMIETILTTYFLMKKSKKVISYSAKYKLGKTIGNQMKGKSNYRERKLISVSKCKLFLKNQKMNKELEIINQSKKKDDLSDCFLQILAYINHDFYNSVEMKECENVHNDSKIISRKPSEKQKKKGYSIYNLKFIINNKCKDDIITDVKCINAIEKFYKGNIDNAFFHLKN